MDRQTEIRQIIQEMIDLLEGVSKFWNVPDFVDEQDAWNRMIQKVRRGWLLSADLEHLESNNIRRCLKKLQRQLSAVGTFQWERPIPGVTPPDFAMDQLEGLGKSYLVDLRRYAAALDNSPPTIDATEPESPTSGALESDVSELVDSPEAAIEDQAVVHFHDLSRVPQKILRLLGYKRMNGYEIKNLIDEQSGGGEYARQSLVSMKNAGYLENDRKGYSVRPKFHYLLKEMESGPATGGGAGPDDSQGHSQD